MRVLAVPIYSYAGNVLADSGYICFRNLIRAIPEWTWHLVVPDWANDERYPYPHDDLDDLPNVVKVPVPMHTLYRAQEVTLDQEFLWRYAPQGGSQPIDAVVCGSNQIAAIIANAWEIRMEESDRPLVVAWDLLTRDDRNKGWRSADVELVAHFAGAVNADLNVFGSEMMRRMTWDMLRKIFSPAVARDAMNRSETIYAGVPIERIDEITAGIRKRDKFTVFYGGRMGSVKRVDDLTEIADLAFSFGRDMGMVVCTGSLSGIRKNAFQKQFPMVELHVGTGQDDAWRLMAECHVGFMWSRHEMIGSMFVEEMAHGLPLIAHRHPWLQSLLPEEYPYWVDNAREGGAALRVLYERWLDDPAEYDAVMRPWSQYVRERYNSVAAGQQFRGVVERVAAERRAPQKFGASMLELVEQVIEEGMTFEELVEGVKSSARKRAFMGETLVSGRSNPTLDAYRAAQHLGWRDVGTDVPVFTKKETH